MFEFNLFWVVWFFFGYIFFGGRGGGAMDFLKKFHTISMLRRNKSPTEQSIDFHYRFIVKKEFDLTCFSFLVRWTDPPKYHYTLHKKTHKNPYALFYRFKFL